jgi:hypothetical protein
MFKLLKTDASSRARLGRLTTPHGVVARRTRIVLLGHLDANEFIQQLR